MLRDIQKSLKTKRAVKIKATWCGKDKITLPALLTILIFQHFRL